ncbi:MAG: patatin-like phospholipase family protein [Proteobacteria bacterium]|nr:patatin-like phospholipase family protein [Pseudomonadota bacterium]
MRSRPRIAVVLAGAVAKGAFEAGVLQAIAETDVEIIRVVAASSGALNGTVLAAAVRSRDVVRGADMLAQLWRDRAEWNDVFHPSLADLLARRAVSDQTRIRALLKALIPPSNPADAAEINLRLLVAVLEGAPGTVGDHAATTFESVCDFTGDDFATADKLDHIFDAATASSAFPLVFSPVNVGKLGPCIDGGAVNNTPVKWALEGALGTSIDAVVVVATTVEQRTGPPPPLHGLAYAGHLATMLIGERLYRDLREAEQVNTSLAALEALVARGVLDDDQRAAVLDAVGWTGRRPIAIVQIRPLTELAGSSFAGFFSPALRAEHVERGRARGREVLGAFSARSPRT